MLISTNIIMWFTCITTAYAIFIFLNLILRYHMCNRQMILQAFNSWTSFTKHSTTWWGGNFTEIHSMVPTYNHSKLSQTDNRSPEIVSLCWFNRVKGKFIKPLYFKAQDLSMDINWVGRHVLPTLITILSQVCWGRLHEFYFFISFYPSKIYR